MEESIMQIARAIAPIAQIVIAVIALALSTWVAVWTTRRNREAADIQYWRSVRDQWMEIDKFALSSDENLRMVDLLFHPDLAGQPIEDRRKRWIGYMIFSVIMSQYFGTEDPEVNIERGHRERERSELKTLMRDNVLYHLTQTPAYSSTFQKLCRALREEQNTSAS